MIVIEAWGNRPPGARTYDLPHLVRYRPDTEKVDLRAFCGVELAALKYERYGTAANVGIRVCTACTKWLEGQARPAKVLTLPAGRIR